MFKKNRVRKGYVILYSLIMGSLCMLFTLYILKMEYIKFENISGEINSLNKKSVLQQDREFILSKIDKEFYKDKRLIDKKNFDSKLEELKKNPKTKDKFKFNDSYAYFDKNLNIVIDYSVKNKFYKEEIYNVRLDKKNLKYHRITASYKKKGGK